MAVVASAQVVQSPKIQEVDAGNLTMIDGFLSSLSNRNGVDVNDSKTLLGIYSSTYGWNYKTAYAVMLAESGGNPKAINAEWHYKNGKPICQGSFGLFQLACLHGTKEDLLNPRKNIEIAYALWEKEGFYPWSVCKNGMVNCFK